MKKLWSCLFILCFACISPSVLLAGGTEPPAEVSTVATMGSEAEAVSDEGQKASVTPHSKSEIRQMLRAEKHKPHPQRPDFTGLAVAFLIFFAATLAGIVFLIIALVSGPPWWTVALICLSPLAFILAILVLIGIISGIRALVQGNPDKKK